MSFCSDLRPEQIYYHRNTEAQKNAENKDSFKKQTPKFPFRGGGVITNYTQHSLPDPGAGSSSPGNYHQPFVK